jgi:hypothetical protein
VLLARPRGFDPLTYGFVVRLLKQRIGIRASQTQISVKMTSLICGSGSLPGLLMFVQWNSVPCAFRAGEGYNKQC